MVHHDGAKIHCAGRVPLATQCCAAISFAKMVMLGQHLLEWLFGELCRWGGSLINKADEVVMSVVSVTSSASSYLL